MVGATMEQTSHCRAQLRSCQVWAVYALGWMLSYGMHGVGDVFGAVGPWGPRHRGARGQGVRAVHVPYGQAVCTAVGTAVQVTVGVA